MEKVYVLTDCAAEDNYTPRVFKDKQKAREAFLEQVEEYLVDECYDVEEDGEPEQTYNGKPVYDYVDNFEIQGDRAEIVYSDDTYNVLEIFEVEVK